MSEIQWEKSKVTRKKEKIPDFKRIMLLCMCFEFLSIFSIVTIFVLLFQFAWVMEREYNTSSSIDNIIFIIISTGIGSIPVIKILIQMILHLFNI